MVQIIKKWKWVASFLLTITIAFFIIAAFIYTPEDKESENPAASSPQAEKKEDVERGNDDNEDDTVAEPKEEVHPNEQEGTISEGLREVFTSVIESARDLFIREDLKIVAMGDSLTQGIGDTTDNEGYVGILEETFNSNQESETIDIENYGIRGNRSDQLLKRMNSDELNSSLKKADVVIITIGANDVMKVVKNNFTNLNYQDFVSEQQGFEKRLNEILEGVEDVNSDASIYLVGLYNPFNHYFNNIPELGQIISDWNSISESVIEEHEQAFFVPIKDIFAGSEEDLIWKEDHFHPNERGYKKMAERMLEYMRSDIEQ